MLTLEAATMDYLYRPLIDATWDQGAEYQPRGYKCTEVRPATFSLLEPRKGLYRGESRRLNYRFFAVETLMYLGGWGTWPYQCELLVRANGNMGNFVNPDTQTFDGAYGPRLEKSLECVIELLTRDPYSRQAVAAIWDPNLHHTHAKSVDIPCTVSLQFYRNEVRNEIQPRLSCSTTMRSNDLNWGMPYDVAAFCTIQCFVAGCLGWDVGQYHHTVGSLHVYHDSKPTVASHAIESFHPALALPDLSRSPDPVPEQLAVATVGDFLEEIYSEVIVAGVPWHEFRSTLEEHDFLGWWFKQWGDLIRFRWEPRK